MNQSAYYRFTKIPNIATDVAMLAVPLPIVWKLQTSLLQKIGLTLIFMTGSVSVSKSA